MFIACVMCESFIAATLKTFCHITNSTGAYLCLYTVLYICIHLYAGLFRHISKSTYFVYITLHIYASVYM